MTMSLGNLVVLLLSPVFCYSATPHLLANKLLPLENFHHVDVEKVKPNIEVESVKDIIIDKYFNSTELTELLDKMSSDYGHIMKVTKLGKSPVDQEEIRAIQISSNVQQERELLKPMFRFVANIHGDDAVGYALMVSLVQYLVYSYEVDSRIKDILNTIDVWIIPTLNPDGLRHAKVGWCESPEIFTDKYDPENANMLRVKKKLSRVAYESFADKMKENIQRLVEMYNFKTEFVLSGNIKAGAIVASYPFSKDIGFPGRLAKTYARQNPMMEPGDACNQTFRYGITHGKPLQEKHSEFRGLQNDQFNCLDITLYLGCCRYPKPEYLPFYWAANLEAMLTLMESTRKGVFGLVTDVTGKPIKSADISVQEMGSRIKVTDKGEYWWPLLPGTYTVTASRKLGLGVCNFKDQKQFVRVTNEEPYVRLDFVLKYQATIQGFLYDKHGKLIRYGAGFVIVGSQNLEAEPNPETGYYQLTLGVDEGDTTYVTAGAVGYGIQTKTVNTRNVNVEFAKNITQIDFFLDKELS